MEFDQTPPPLPPPSTEKKDSVLYKVLIGGCGCLIVLAIIFILMFGRIFGFTHGPKHIVENQLKAINDNNYSLAYNQFSHQFRERTTLEAFRNDLGQFSTLFPYKEYALSRITINNDHARVEGTVTARDGAIFPIRYDLVREQGKWRISNYEWTPPGERQRV